MAGPREKQQQLAQLVMIHHQENQHQQNLRIFLWSNSIGAKGCLYLARVQFKHLQCLNLSENQVGDEGCSHLVKGNWPTLQDLSLRRNRITSKGCLSLCQGEWLHLKQLVLTQNNIGKSVFGALKERFMKVKQLY